MVRVFFKEGVDLFVRLLDYTVVLLICWCFFSISVDIFGDVGFGV